MLILAFAALLQTPAAAPATSPELAGAPDYRADAAWLCLPARADVCAAPLPTTPLTARGYGRPEDVRPAASPAVDCFYIYPTVSRDSGLNSDLEPGTSEEIGAAVAQLARFGGVCRTFAPLYRSLTLGSLRPDVPPADVGRGFVLAYGDVRAAWRDYLAHRNDGRPFVLIGHSQGTIHLTRLIQEEIEGRPEAARMLSAMLIGFNVEVPEGETRGGTFRETPICTRPGETGCIVTYVSFRATNPPPAGALFGRAARPGMTVACTNPAALGERGAHGLDSYWLTSAEIVRQADISWSQDGPPPTPFLRTEGLARAACVQRGPVGYLSVAVDPGGRRDRRTDEIPGDTRFNGALVAGWGLHPVDMNLALGDLIRIVETQAAAVAD